jgi:hypothetical protein
LKAKFASAIEPPTTQRRRDWVTAGLRSFTPPPTRESQARRVDPLPHRPGDGPLFLVSRRCAAPGSGSLGVVSTGIRSTPTCRVTPHPARRRRPLRRVHTRHQHGSIWCRQRNAEKPAHLTRPAPAMASHGAGVVGAAPGKADLFEADRPRSQPAMSLATASPPCRVERDPDTGVPGARGKPRALGAKRSAAGVGRSTRTSS